MGNKQSFEESPSRYISMSHIPPSISKEDQKDPYDSMYSFKIRAGYSDLEEASIHMNKCNDTVESTIKRYLRELNSWITLTHNNDSIMEGEIEHDKNYLTRDPNYRTQYWACMSARIVEDKRQIYIHSLHCDKLEAYKAEKIHYSNNNKYPVYIIEVGKWTLFPELVEKHFIKNISLYMSKDLTDDVKEKDKVIIEKRMNSLVGKLKESNNF
jgi:hypothetical protein